MSPTMKSLFLCFTLLFLHNTVTATPLNRCSCDSEIIDLGYARHNVTWQSLTPEGRRVNVYKNIRFAEPAKRFRKPTFPPNPDDPGVIRTGNYTQDTQCVSVIPQGAEILFPG